MQNKKLLIIGDSFSADSSLDSWTNMLQNFSVTNLSSNGSSQYRIYKKLVSTDLQNFTHVIIVHTSPYRIYIEHNPLHQSSLTHRDCDLIYQDIKNLDKTNFAKNVAWYFENVFDLEQANVMHHLLVEKIKQFTAHLKSLHISFFENSLLLPVTNLNHLWKLHPGKINHLNKIGNKKVAEFINNTL